MSKLETSSSSVQTSNEPTSKSDLQAAVGGLQAAGVVGGAVEFLGIHLTKGAVQVPEVKETRQKISQMAGHVESGKGVLTQMAEQVESGKGVLTQMAADVKGAKLAIFAGVCFCGFCAAGSFLMNFFQKGNGGDNDRGDGGVQERQLVPIVPTREWDRS